MSADATRAAAGDGQRAARINEKVVEVHLDEAPFLWILRDRASLAANYSLRDLADLDERVEAHVDGLRVAGAGGWSLCEKALGSGDPGVVFVAAVVAFGSAHASRIDAVLQAAISSTEAGRGLISAIGWVPFEMVAGIIAPLLDAEDPALRRLAIAGHAVHRRDPGQALANACSATDPSLRARACQAAGELGRADLLPRLSESLSEPDPEVRFCAAWAAARLGDRADAVIQSLRDTAVTGGPEAERSLDAAMRAVSSDHATGWFNELRQDPQRLRLAVQGAGAIGDPGLVPLLIELMDNDEVCRVAGQAVTCITGIDLAYIDLDRDAPMDYEGGPNDRPEDENVAMDSDDDLPWPDTNRVAQWWESERRRFRSENQYLWGQPKTEGTLPDVLRTGTQSVRGAAALELGLRTLGPLFEVRAPGSRQLGLL